MVNFACFSINLFILIYSWYSIYVQWNGNFCQFTCKRMKKYENFSSKRMQWRKSKRDYFKPSWSLIIWIWIVWTKLHFNINFIAFGGWNLKAHKSVGINGSNKINVSRSCCGKEGNLFLCYVSQTKK